MPRKQKDGKIKLKTHKATSKRFGITGTGKIVRTKGGKAHLRRKRSDRVTALFGEMVPGQRQEYHQAYPAPGATHEALGSCNVSFYFATSGCMQLECRQKTCTGARGLAGGKEWLE